MSAQYSLFDGDGGRMISAPKGAALQIPEEDVAEVLGTRAAEGVGSYGEEAER